MTVGVLSEAARIWEVSSLPATALPDNTVVELPVDEAAPVSTADVTWLSTSRWRFARPGVYRVGFLVHAALPAGVVAGFDSRLEAGIENDNGDIWGMVTAYREAPGAIAYTLDVSSGFVIGVGSSAAALAVEWWIRARQVSGQAAAIGFGAGGTERGWLTIERLGRDAGLVDLF
jgi:hypothetical protein